MLKSYEKLYPVLDMRDQSLKPVIPNDNHHAIMLSLVPVLEKLISITMALQRADLKFFEARQILDGIIQTFDSDDEFKMASKIGRNAKLIVDPIFESALFKIQVGREDT